MKYTLALLLSLLFMKTSMAQDVVRLVDKKTDRLMLKGRVTFDDLMDESAFDWFRDGQRYEYNKLMVENLERLYKPYQFVVFLGTWCSDSQDLIPKLYTVLKQSNFDFNAITLYAVDRQKEAINEETQNYKIDKVPTIIVLHGNREVARITETVATTIEQDLLTILEKDYTELERKREEKWGHD